MRSSISKLSPTAFLRENQLFSVAQNQARIFPKFLSKSLFVLPVETSYQVDHEEYFLVVFDLDEVVQGTIPFHSCRSIHSLVLMTDDPCVHILSNVLYLHVYDRPTKWSLSTTTPSSEHAISVAAWSLLAGCRGRHQYFLHHSHFDLDQMRDSLSSYSESDISVIAATA